MTVSMMTKSLLLQALLLTLAFASCNKATPAGFWKSYQKKYLVKNISNQGPYGGHRAIYWKSDQPSTFTSSCFLDLAIKNGWTLVDSSEFTEDQIHKWTYINKPIFPLSHTGLSDTAASVSTYEHFPRWFSGRIKVYKFKSGWIAIQPGTDNWIEENGYVILNNDESEMGVYHLWGE
jgi:hypothetical protein